MQVERILDTDHPDWDMCWKIYEASFPQNERRTLDVQRPLFALPHYRWQLWRDAAGGLIGFTATWEYERFCFLEHFAVHPEKRSGGYGRKILTALMSVSHPTFLLEIDVLTDEISSRRWQFYERLGFVDNGIAHGHPSYFDGTGHVPLLLLSHERKIDRALYDEFARCQREDMLAHLKPLN